VATILAGLPESVPSITVAELQTILDGRVEDFLLLDVRRDDAKILARIGRVTIVGA
jgi:hypothetical protein